ncbi:MAG: alpha/beta hydrolase [Leptolyngbyaceae bacterium]|nr:alpha/beta hydrolase [Leptolyngbyaceae bacterium]
MYPKASKLSLYPSIGLITLVFSTIGWHHPALKAQTADAIPTRYPLPEALDDLTTDETVEVIPPCLTEICINNLVESRAGIVFSPQYHDPTVGVVFYPGGKVDPRAYAPLVNDLAANGVLSVIVPMPDNLAFLGGDRAQDVMAAYPHIQEWYLAGHSLGGAIAVRYAIDRPQDLAGLLLLGVYVNADTDLSHIDIPVTSIYGLQDGVVTPDEVEHGKPFLPTDTQYIPLAGANHAQFGTYGAQAGDLEATISPQQQQALTVTAMLCGMGLAEAQTCEAMGFDPEF